MPGSGGLIKSFSDMELNLMDEAAKRSGDADAASSNEDVTPSTTTARSPDHWNEPARLPGAPPQKVTIRCSWDIGWGVDRGCCVVASDPGSWPLVPALFPHRCAG